MMNDSFEKFEIKGRRDVAIVSHMFTYSCACDFLYVESAFILQAKS